MQKQNFLQTNLPIFITLLANIVTSEFEFQPILVIHEWADSGSAEIERKRVRERWERERKRWRERERERERKERKREKSESERERGERERKKKRLDDGFSKLTCSRGGESSNVCKSRSNRRCCLDEKEPHRTLRKGLHQLICSSFIESLSFIILFLTLSSGIKLLLPPRP